MFYIHSRNYIKSRNTLIIFIILFLVFALSFKYVMRFVVDNIIIFTGTVVDSGHVDPSAFEVSWDSVDFSKLNPMLWQMDEIKKSLNVQLHDLVDIIAPAIINLLRMVVIQSHLLNQSMGMTPVLLYNRLPFGV